MIQVRRALHAELCFHVLSQLDLGRDAASLFNRRHPPKPWTVGLLAAYREAPGRLTVQGLPLCTPDLPTLMEVLSRDRIQSLRDPPGRKLARLFVEALEIERPAVEAAWYAQREDAAQAAFEFLARAEQLQHVRECLWHEVGRPPPALEVLDCPSLATTGGSHGRGVDQDGRRAVAVSLVAPIDQALCQVLHEEMHPATDPIVRSKFVGAQDTRMGTDGFRLHRKLEIAAIETGQRLLERHAPELLDAYRTWRKRNGS